MGTAATDTAVRDRSRWLFGPGPDLIFGCGVGYAVVLGLLLVDGPRMTEWLPLGMLPLLLLVTGTPHYGATLLRVYEQRESRRRYAVFAIGASAVLAVAFVASLQWYALGSLLLTLYFNWNPWHYGGQNYGLALMFLHRRGVRVTPGAKRLLYASFVLSAVLAVLEMNGAAAGALYAPEDAGQGAKVIGPAYRFVSIGIPSGLQAPLVAGALLAYLACTVAAFAAFRREGSFRDLGPSMLLTATQSLWFVAPAALRIGGGTGGLVPFEPRYALYAFMWVAVGHAVQYLWVTAYYARREHRLGHAGTWFLKSVLAGAALWHIPALVFAPIALGTVSYSDGLRLLIAASVNLHHFVLDGAIWKLRDGRVAGLLLRSSDGDDPQEAPARSLVRPLVWAAGTVGLALAVVGTWEREMGVRRAAARGDVPRLEQAAQRLAWIGQGEASVHRTLADVAIRQGRVEQALAELDKSLALKEHPKVHFQKGRLYARRQQWERAAAEYEAAYRIDPHPLLLVSHLSDALIRAGRVERAEEVLEAGLERHPGDERLTELLQQARQAARQAAVTAG